MLAANSASSPDHAGRTLEYLVSDAKAGSQRRRPVDASKPETACDCTAVVWSGSLNATLQAVTGRVRWSPPDAKGETSGSDPAMANGQRKTACTVRCKPFSLLLNFGGP